MRITNTSSFGHHSELQAFQTGSAISAEKSRGHLLSKYHHYGAGIVQAG